MRLNLGCGRDVRPDWVNVDRHPDEDVFGMDLDHHDQWPLVWRNRCEEILLQDVIEHLHRPGNVLNEAVNCLCSGGVLRIRGPHYTCRDTWTDDTHVRGLSSEFVPRLLERGDARVRVRLGFEWWNLWVGLPLHLAYCLFGERVWRLYESTFLCALAPAKYVHVTIRRGA